MPIDVTFEDPRTFVLCAEGDVTADESQAALRTLIVHERFGPGVLILADARTVTGAPPADEMRGIARGLVPLVDSGLSAMAIVTDSQLIYGMARMFSTFADSSGAKVSVFRAMDEARAWLAER
jgi:hypothetical protein